MSGLIPGEEAGQSAVQALSGFSLSLSLPPSHAQKHTHTLVMEATDQTEALRGLQQAAANSREDAAAFQINTGGGCWLIQLTDQVTYLLAPG